MFKTAYDTTACIGYQDSIRKALEEISKQEVLGSKQIQIAKNLMKEGNSVKDAPPFWGVRAIYPGIADISPFAHPINEDRRLAVGKNADDSETVYIDVRSFSRLDQQGEPVVTAARDYSVMSLRGALQSVWNGVDTFRDLLNLGDYQLTVYARWISETLTRRLTLPPEIQMKLAVYAAYYYLCQFITDDQKEIEQKDYIRMATMIARSTYVNVEETLNLIEDLPILTNIQSFIDLLKEKSESARYEQLNLALFVSIFGGSWLGANSREVSVVAVEHPPTFIALLAIATLERSATRSAIGQIAETFKKDDQSKTFLYNLHHVFRRNTY